MPNLLTRNARGPEVLRLRKALAAQLGDDAALFGSLAAGDVLDATVEAAIRRWQSGVGLIADGVVGPRCMEILGLATRAPMALALDLASVRKVFPATKPANIDRYLPYVAAALAAVGLTDRPMILAALGTIRANNTTPTAPAPSAANATTANATSDAHSAVWKPPHASSALRSPGLAQSSRSAASRSATPVTDTPRASHVAWLVDH